MPGGRDLVGSEGDPPELTLRQRLLLALPRLGREGTKASLSERFKEAVVKPVEPGAAAKAKAADVPMTVPELEEAVAKADDKERLTGLLLAPVAAAIGFIVIDLLVADDPAKLLKNGAPNPKYVSPSLYHELALVLLALAVLMMVTAFYRKRLFLGIVMALYGLAVFNLHYWGFGIPYILAGAWLLVRAYRYQRDLKEARGEGPARAGGPSRGGPRGPGGPAPRPNKRYTPPAPPPKPPSSRRASKRDEKRAG